jgi:hypothetical protein
MRYITTALLALSVLAGAGVAAQADVYPYGNDRTTEQQEPSPN